MERIVSPQPQMATWDRAGSNVLNSCKADGEEGWWFQRCQTQLPPSPGAESHSIHTLLRMGCGLLVLPCSVSCEKLTEASRGGYGLQ